MPGTYHFPLDPKCPTAPKIDQFLDDPITRFSGCGDEFVPVLENGHREHCKQCQEYGAANVEVA